MRVVVKDSDRDSTNWDKVIPRETDIIIASCYKTGTTLTQQILNVLFNGNSDFHGFPSLHELSPWVEEIAERFFVSQEGLANHIEKLPNPRLLKTHLPFEALPYHPQWKYIYLVRDARDVAWSLFNHLKACPSKLSVTSSEQSFVEFCDQWLATGKPMWSYLEHMESWWQVKHLPNILFVHYVNLTKNKADEVQRIANFLNEKLDSERLELIMYQSSLEFMKTHWEKFQPPGFLPQTFIREGKSGGWKEFVTPEKSEEYEKLVTKKLGMACAQWMKHGGPLPPLPVFSDASVKKAESVALH